MANDIPQKIDFGTHAILVSRVSTPAQEWTDDVLPQLEDLKVYAKALGYVHHHCIGTTESGFLEEDDKQGWNLVKDYISQNPQFRTIICTGISRLSRRENILVMIRDFLCDNKIQLYIKDIGFTLLDEFGNADKGKKAIFSLYASLASSEMQEKEERFRRARKNLKKMGYSIGGRRLFGYDRVYEVIQGDETNPDSNKRGKKKRSKYIENKEESKYINTLFEWYAYGIDHDLTITSLDRITQECIARNFPKYLQSRRNVNKCLKESAYIGIKITKNRRKNADYWNYKKLDAPKYVFAESFECKYPPIVDKELFDVVQHKMSKLSTHNKKTSNNQYVDKSKKHKTILSKILVCPICGKFLIGEYRIKEGTKKHTYRCTNAKGLLKTCTYRKSLSMVNLDSTMWAFLKSKVTEIISKKKQRYESINKEEIQKRINNLSDELNHFEVKYKVINQTFKTMSSRIGYDKAFINYQKEVAGVDKEKEQIERIISQNKKLLLEIENRENTNAKDEEIKDKITKMSNDKEDIYNYMHLLIRTVKPLLATKSHTVLEIITFDNIDEVFDYGKEDASGLPVIKSEKHDNLYFICIDKHNTNRIRARLISHNQAFWNVEGEYFYVSGDKTHFTVEDIFALPTKDENAYPDFHLLWTGLEELDYQPLDVYDKDSISSDEVITETIIADE